MNELENKNESQVNQEVNISQIIQPNNKKNSNVLFIILGVVLLIGLAVAGYMLFIKKPDNNPTKEESPINDKNNENKEEDNIVKEFKQYDIYSELSDDNYQDYIINDSIKELDEADDYTYKKLYSYKCQSSDCVVNTFNNAIYLLAYDNSKFYLVNMTKQTKKLLNISIDNFCTKSLYSYMADDKNVKYISINYLMEESDEFTTAIVYSIEKDKIVYKTDNLYDDLAVYDYVDKNDLIIDRCNVIDLLTGQTVHTFEANLNLSAISEQEGEYCSITANSEHDIVYMRSDEEGLDSYKMTLYNKDFEKIVSIKDQMAFSESGNILVKSKNRFIEYDYNGNVVRTSKNYEKLLLILDKYFAAVESGYIKLFDINEKEIASFVKWDSKNNYFHVMLSGYYTEGGKYGIYLVVEDQRIGDSQGYEYYYDLKTGKTGKIKTEIGGYAKPVLYLYPEKDINVSISFTHKEYLTTTYPKFNEEWNVLAKKDGSIYDKNNKYYYGLYWEEKGYNKVNFDEGFYVTKNNAIDFLEEKLSIIGLTRREQNEFIMYWLPILEKNEKSLVYFEFTEDRQNYNELIITPKPKSLLRLAIHIKKVDAPVGIKEEKLPSFNRKGFTAVEWGGVNY